MDSFESVKFELPMRPVQLIYIVIVVGFLFHSGRAQDELKVDFVRDVQPLFNAHCVGCHGPKQQKNGFLLDRRRDGQRGGTANQIGPGNSEASRLYLRLVGNETGLQMPPDGPLSAEQIKMIKTWIDQGAAWPDKASGENAAVPSDPRVTQMMDLLRDGERDAFQELLRLEVQRTKRGQVSFDFRKRRDLTPFSGARWGQTRDSGFSVANARMPPC